MHNRLTILSIFLFLFLTGCTTTDSISFKISPNSEKNQKLGYELNFSSQGGEKSEWTKYFEHKFCGLNFETVVSEINPKDDWDSYSKVKFINGSSNQSFSILFYFDKQIGKITPLIKHSLDDAAEPLGMKFNVNQEMVIMIYTENDNFGISIDAQSKVDNILKFTGEGEHTESFEFQEVSVGFIPTSITFMSIGVNTKFKDVKFDSGC